MFTLSVSISLIIDHRRTFDSMPKRSDIEHMAAHNAMQIAGSDLKTAGVWYRKLVPWAKFPAKPKLYFSTWFKRLGAAAHGAYKVVMHPLGRPKKIPDHTMLAIAKGPLQRCYYSHGEPVLPLSVTEVSTCTPPCQPCPPPHTRHPNPRSRRPSNDPCRQQRGCQL